jgi:Flp pilus assembly protein TadD
MYARFRVRMRTLLIAVSFLVLAPCLVACPSNHVEIKEPDQINPLTAEGMTPAQVDASLKEARVWIKEGKVHEAINLLDSVARHAPNNAEVFHLRGVARMRLGHFKYAIPDFQTAAEIKPTSDLYYNLGIVLHIYGFQHRAVAAFRTALELGDRNDPEILNNLASTYIHLGRYAEAVTILESVTQARPGDGEAFTNLGVAHFLLGDLNAAERALLSAVSADSNYAEAHYNLGRVYEKMGRADAAAASYRRYVDVRPNAPDLEAVERTINRLLHSPTS